MYILLYCRYIKYNITKYGYLKREYYILCINTSDEYMEQYFLWKFHHWSLSATIKCNLQVYQWRVTTTLLHTLKYGIAKIKSWSTMKQKNVHYNAVCHQNVDIFQDWLYRQKLGNLYLFNIWIVNINAQRTQDRFSKIYRSQTAAVQLRNIVSPICSRQIWWLELCCLGILII